MSPCEQQLLFLNNSQIQYCIKWDGDNNHLKLQGIRDSQFKSYLKVNLKLCDNCQKLESIEIKLLNSYIDNYDNHDPHKYISHTEIVQLSKSFQKQLNIQYQVINFETDNGYIVEELIQSSSLTISKSQIINNDLVDGNQFQMLITLDKITQNTKRSYQKIQMILSDLGGLTEILYLFCFILILPYNEITYRLKLLNELFNFNMEQEQEEKNKNKNKNKNDAQVFPTETTMTKSRMRLKSIFNKTIQLEKVNRMTRGRGSEDNQKSKIIASISGSITEFLKEQQQKLELGFCDYILYFCPSKQGSKSELVHSSMLKISKTLDITYIIQKLHEIDKLKQLFMDENQLKLFDCLPKPQIGSTQIHQPSYLSILKPEQSDLAKALQAQQAYEEIAEHSDNTINHKLIEMLDQDLLQLFQMHMDRQIRRKNKKQVTLLRLQRQVRSNELLDVQSISDSDSDSNDSNK